MFMKMQICVALGGVSFQEHVERANIRVLWSPEVQNLQVSSQGSLAVAILATPLFSIEVGQAEGDPGSCSDSSDAPRG